jgi:hypothetical protein
MNQELRDRNGSRIGTIKDEGNRQIIYDRNGSRLGYYDGKSTYDRTGRRVGDGNLLTSLLVHI